eukprot:TRINITY_DN30676_c0_g1_i2.p1 TRINITY_DN30676_c0_g1~~TRINITY_DN30676_c0_g1_i2.p1  ORF type:complete len:160 (-),score=34.76 TRINITY_DN30676_c0_g1_i2:272-751(-)
MTEELLYIRMRLPPDDEVPERPLLEYEELLRTPQIPEDSCFNYSSRLQQTREAGSLAADRGQTPFLRDGFPLLEAVNSPSFRIDGRCPRLRRDMDGACCIRRCRTGPCPGRRFPDFGTGNQFLQPEHFANLCQLGAEMSLSAARYAALVCNGQAAESSA